MHQYGRETRKEWKGREETSKLGGKGKRWWSSDRKDRNRYSEIKIFWSYSNGQKGEEGVKKSWGK